MKDTNRSVKLETIDVYPELFKQALRYGLMLIITTGMPGSGKEEVLKVLMRTGLPIVRMGDVVRDHAKTNGIDTGDSGIGGYANDQRDEHGADVWAQRSLEIVNQISGSKDEDVVIDGSRSLHEIEHFKNNSDVKVIAVHSSPSVRFGRLKGRKRDDAPKTLEEFNARDNRELSWGIGNVIATADFLIVNEGSLNEFKGQVREVVGKLLARSF